MGDVQRWVWGLAIYEEWWMEVRPLKLRDIPSSVSRRGHLVYKGIFRTRAANKAANPAPWLSMDTPIKRESRHQIVSSWLIYPSAAKMLT